jgi:hypothetical protein
VFSFQFKTQEGQLQSGIPSGVVSFLQTLITTAGILAFAGMFGRGIYKVWTKSTKPDSDAFVYVATALAALVGGIVAVGFGQKPPPSGVNFAAQTSLVALGALVSPLTALNWAEILGAAYATVYVLFGLAAIVTWTMGPNSVPTPPLVKNLATTFLGMAIPIISAFFSTAK